MRPRAATKKNRKIVIFTSYFKDRRQSAILPVVYLSSRLASVSGANIQEKRGDDITLNYLAPEISVFSAERHDRTFC